MFRRFFNSVKYRSYYTFKNISSHIDVSEEVRHAIEKKSAIVALESTIITHGMPYPNNLKTALEVEDIVRSNGAVPATIAILDGRIKVGLTNESLKSLSLNKTKAIKCSRRDLPFIVGHNKCGGTTVCGTMLIAHMLGLKVFATGGIGGVHRNGQDTLDISADLIELGRTPVTVVCSGVKSILDIPRTLEYLETHGVCVATYGEANGIFPDFYTRDSGCRVPYNLSGPKEAANMIRTLHELKMSSGALIAVPIPKEYALVKQLISLAIDEAYTKANDQGIEGKDVTPFLLEAISKITKGTSLEANMALIKNNAFVAAQISRELYSGSENYVLPTINNSNTDHSLQNTPLIIGASILDLSFTMNTEIPKTFNGATYPVQVKQSGGGVGRNLAEGIYKIHGQVDFISAVGNDEIGKSLLNLMPSDLSNSIVVCDNESTSLCSLLFDVTGDCKLILGNMDIHQRITPDIIMQNEKKFRNAPLIVIDSNLSETTMECILKLAHHYNRPVFFEPTDMLISGKPFKRLPSHLTNMIKFTSPNIYELKTIAETITGKNVEHVPDAAQDVQLILEQTKAMLKDIQNRFDCIIVTLGHHGVVISLRKEFKDQPLYDIRTMQYLMKNNPGEHIVTFFSAPRIENITNVSGAGDSFSSGFITGLLRGYPIKRCVSLGFEAAKCSLQSSSAVPKTYSIFENDYNEAVKVAK